METHFPHLADLRALAADAARDATELQRRLAAKMRGGEPITQEEMFSARALMHVAATGQSLYLRELERSHSAVVSRSKTAG